MPDLVLGGSNSRHIAYKLSKSLKADYSQVEIKEFPDSELYVRIPVDVGEKDVIYVNSLQPNPNRSLVETILTLDAIKKQRAKSVTAVVPYLAYARQDEMFNPGEAVSIYTVAELFKTLNLDLIVTVDMHLHRITEPSKVFGSKFMNITGMHQIAEFIKNNFNYSDSVVIGPDEEAEQWASVVAKDLGLEYGVFSKKRLSGREVQVEGQAQVKDRDVIIVDDIISTGGTIIEASKLLRRLGARDIYVACVHPLLVEGAYHKLVEQNFKAIIGTDTVLSPISFVEIHPAIAKALKS
mgnify:CR=1 FL=1